eukprot:g21349.t1
MADQLAQLTAKAAKNFGLVLSKAWHWSLQSQRLQERAVSATHPGVAHGEAAVTRTVRDCDWWRGGEPVVLRPFLTESRKQAIQLTVSKVSSAFERAKICQNLEAMKEIKEQLCGLPGNYPEVERLRRRVHNAIEESEPRLSEGIAGRAISELFQDELFRRDWDILGRQPLSRRFVVTASMFELYRNRLVDLLAVARGPRRGKSPPCSPKLNLRPGESGAQVDNLSEEEVQDPWAESMFGSGLGRWVGQDAMQLKRLLYRGSAVRSTAPNALNVESSRSHLIFTIKVTTIDGPEQLTGKLVLCDLGGSERLKKSEATGEQLKEAIEINRSLTALGDVIEAVAERKRQVPYRNHKLTQLLQELRVFAMRRFRVMRGGGDTALVAAAGRLMGFKADTPGRMVYRCREFLFVPLQRSCRWRIHHRPPRPMKTGILFYQKLIIQIVNTRFLIM